jgi:hypothetical protein
LFNGAWSLLNRGDLPDKPVRLIGIGLSGWERSGDLQQRDMFTTENSSQKELLTTIDKITERYGADSLSLGLRRGQPDRKKDSE